MSAFATSERPPTTPPEPKSPAVRAQTMPQPPPTPFPPPAPVSLPCGMCTDTRWVSVSASLPFVESTSLAVTHSRPKSSDACSSALSFRPHDGKEEDPEVTLPEEKRVTVPVAPQRIFVLPSPPPATAQSAAPLYVSNPRPPPPSHTPASVLPLCIIPIASVRGVTNTGGSFLAFVLHRMRKKLTVMIINGACQPEVFSQVDDQDYEKVQDPGEVAIFTRYLRERNLELEVDDPRTNVAKFPFGSLVKHTDEPRMMCFVLYSFPCATHRRMYLTCKFGRTRNKQAHRKESITHLCKSVFFFSEWFIWTMQGKGVLMVLDFTGLLPEPCLQGPLRFEKLRQRFDQWQGCS